LEPLFSATISSDEKLAKL
jgi:dynein heavy chain